MDFKEQLRNEIKYLPRNDKIRIRNIIIKDLTKDIIYSHGTGLQIELDKLSQECLDEIKDYIELEYEKLHQKTIEQGDTRFISEPFKFYSNSL